MILDKLVMQDFGVFRGRRILDIAPSDDKPVVLFGGMNGAGKTTILDAIMLVLYGDRAACSRRGDLSYRDFLEASINTAADPAEGACLELSFRQQSDRQTHSYLVQRSWHVGKGGVAESVDVSCDGHHDAALTEAWGERVEGFIPARIAGLFFFDGEEIKRLADIENASEFLQTAVNAVLGLDVVHQLDIDLRVVRRSLKGAAVGDTQRTKLEQEEAVLGRLRQELSEAQLRKAGLAQQLDVARRELSRLDQQYQQRGGGLYEQRAAVEAHKDAVSARLAADQEGLRELAAGALPLAMVRRLLRSADRQAATELAAERSGRVLDVIRDRDDRLLAELTSAAVDAVLVERARAWLQRTRERMAAAAKVNRYLNLTPEAAGALDQVVRTGLAAETRVLRDRLKSAAAGGAALSAVERKLATIPDPQALEELVVERGKAKKSVMEKEVELKVADAVLVSCSNRVAHQEQRVDALVERAVEEGFAETDAGRSVAAIDRVAPVLAEFSRRVTRLNLVRLETLIVESLGQLLHKKALLSRIKIAPDTLRLQLYDRDGRELRPEHISAGERQLLAVSMVWGLAKASNRPLPTIIDTPLGRLDSKHRVHLVERYFPSASHQVILLSTDEEVNEKYYQMLRPAVGRSFRLEFDEETQSTNVTPGYFW